MKSLSYSSVSMYLQCPRMFEYRYVRKLPVLSVGAALIQGSAYHAAMAAAMTEKLYQGLPLSLTETLDVYSTSFNQQMTKYESEGTNIDWGGIYSAEWKDKLVPLIKLYYNDYVKELKPKAIEVYKKVMVGGIPVSGRIDLILTNGKVIDHKVSGRTMSQLDADRDLQVTFYAMLEDAPIEFDFHMAVTTKEPKIVCVSTKRTVKNIIWCKNLVRKVWEGINSGIFAPNPTTYRCSPSFCSFQDYCANDCGEPYAQPSADDNELPWED
ncbi:MAG: hypothetical protein DDT33_01638 [Firmicutes bacterium]|nr:hypothetical protein [Bacillota bacterium]